MKRLSIPNFNSLSRKMTAVKTTSQPTSRLGFTLVEMIVVIGIISILAGLVLYGVAGARRNALDAQVRAELTKMENGISNFKNDFGGQLPPSNITLYETEAGWNSDARSKQIIRGLWAQFDFSIDRDFNGNGTAGESVSVTLDGADCLVFFLGGVTKADSSGQIAAIGFSKNVADPFDVNSKNRVKSYVEFDPKRLGDDIVDADNFPSAKIHYVDQYSDQEEPIWYLSSYDGRGYRTADLPSGMTSVYKKGGAADAPDWKSDSYQLISPGRDFEYGTGGAYLAGEKNTTLSKEDKDNVTNFSSGQLK